MDKGNPLDFDKWSTHKGLENWSYEKCLPYFKKIETIQGRQSNTRGNAGPLNLQVAACKNPLFEAFFSSVQEAGYPLTDDVNGHSQEGFSAFDQTISKGRRVSAAGAYIKPILNRKNLTVKLNSQVYRILFQKNRAVGVEFYGSNGLEKIYAHEVICAAGAINSPQLLQLSGIGAADMLKSYDIPVVQDLPGVGENLQDHLEVYIQWRCKKKVSLYPLLNL